MVESEDWLFRPVLRNVLAAEQLLKTDIDLEFIGLLNEALDVEDENIARFHASQKGK